jgi:hypothetical protein
LSVRVYLSGNPVHDRVLEAFAEGCKGELVKDWKYEPSEIAVIFGVYKSKVPISFPRGEIFRQQRSKNKDVIVLETGYINRGDGLNHHYAAGFNGLNGRADFRNQGMPDDRVMILRRQYGLRCLDWRKDGNHILLCGQVPWDASVDHVDYPSWLHFTAGQIKHRSDRPVIFRPHPQAKMSLAGCEQSRKATLLEDLENCWAVVTFNSNSSVESIIEGVPAFTFDAGAMAKGVANHWLDQIESPQMPDRHQWLADLAYAQWTLEEMKEGKAWAHLSR